MERLDVWSVPAIIFDLCLFTIHLFRIKTSLCAVLLNKYAPIMGTRLYLRLLGPLEVLFGCRRGEIEAGSDQLLARFSIRNIIE